MYGFRVKSGKWLILRYFALYFCDQGVMISASVWFLDSKAHFKNFAVDHGVGMFQSRCIRFAIEEVLK